MTAWLQILVGLLPAIALLVIFILKKKVYRLQWSVCACLVAAAGGALIPLAASGRLDQDIFTANGVSRTEDVEMSVEEDDYLSVAYSLMENEDVDAAEEMLDSFSEHYAVSGDYALALARLNVLKGDMNAASGLYKMAASLKISRGRVDKEEESLVNAASGSSYTFAAWNVAAEKVRSAIEKFNEDADGTVDDVMQLYNAVKESCAMWEEMSEEERQTASEEIQSLADDLCKKESGRKYLDIPVVKNTMTKARAITGDHAGILENLDENSGAEELLVTAELVNNGHIRKKDVENSQIYEQKSSDAKEVQEWIEDQLSKTPYTDDEKEVIEEVLENVSDSQDSSASSLIENLIIEHLTEKVDCESSKLYLELAKLYYAKGDREKAEFYLSMALGEAGNSKDREYAGAAGALLDIIKDPDNTEARKNIPYYAETLSENLLPEGTAGITAKKEDTVTEEESGLGHGDSGNTDIPPEQEQQPEQNETFEQYVTDTINQGSGSVNIISVNTENFDEVKAIVAVDDSIASDAEKFKKNLELMDCSIEVSDYKVEKLEYDEINIILVCDNSGSMEGSKIEDLKNALNTFVDTPAEINIGVVPFSDGVKTDNLCSLGSSRQKLKDCVEAMDAFGGTDIRAGVNHALEMFPASDKALNVLVLMSDGQDYEPSEDAVSLMTEACRVKNASIYSMGLGGDVDSDLMTVYSDLGGGSYMYVSDSQSLLSFYQYIYELCMNRYMVTFTAPDNVKANRTLEVEGKDSITAYDNYPYYLYETDVSEDDLGDKYQVTSGGTVIKGLENRLFYRSGIDQQTSLEGEGFKEEDTVQVELHGGLKYSLKTEFTDDSHIKVTIPKDVACGVYDVYVTYNGRRSVFQSGMVMTSNDRHIVRFGDYVFTATDMEVRDNTTVLSGVVSLNGWLGFSDRLTLTGDLENDYTAEMSFDKAYLQYSDSSKGLAHYFWEHGYSLSIPGVHSLKIYNDATIPSDSENYPVDSYFFDAQYFRIVDFIGISGAGLSIYPDRAVVDFEKFDTKFPFQDALMKATGADELFSFNLDHNEQVIFKNDEIGCDIHFELGQDGEDYSSLPGKLGNLRMYVRKASGLVDFNTIDGDIDIKLGVDIAFLSDGCGLELKWSDWKFDSAKVSADKEFNTYIGNVPVTFHDFSLGVSGLSESDGFLDKILGAMWTGSFDCSMAKISEVFPGLEKYIKNDFISDGAVAKLDDTTISFSLKQCYLSVSTKAVIFDIIEVGKCQLELGRGISYTNPLLGMNGESVNGVVGSVTTGVTVGDEHSNFYLTATGTLKAALTDRIIGLTATGEFKVSVSWWIFVKDFQAKGELFFGSYQKHDGNWQFAVYAAGGGDGGSNMTPVCWPSGALNSVSL